MKPSGQSKKQKDWLPLVNFAMVRGHPKRLKLREHLFPYKGCEDDDQEKFIWGVYGTTSINAAIFSAAAYAAGLSRSEDVLVFSLQINTWFRIDDFNGVPSQLSAQDVQDHGYMHLGRLASSYREVVRLKWRDWVIETYPKEADALAAVLDDMTVTDLAVRFPGYARVMLREDKKLHAVVHPVTQTYEEHARAPIWVLTARKDKKRIMACEARFAMDVVVDI
jgi:hypothetical protein